MGEVLGARNPTTIREHLMESLHEIEVLRLLAKGHPATDALRNLQEHAVAALDQLNNAKIVSDVEGIKRIIIDYHPDPGVGAEHAPKEHP